MFVSGVGMFTRTTAATAVAVVAAMTTVTSTAGGSTGTSLTLAARTTALVSALFVPLLTSRNELERCSINVGAA